MRPYEKAPALLVRLVENLPRDPPNIAAGGGRSNRGAEAARIRQWVIAVRRRETRWRIFWER
jgi:hypothetical protein